MTLQLEESIYSTKDYLLETTLLEVQNSEEQKEACLGNTTAITLHQEPEFFWKRIALSQMYIDEKK